MFLSEWRELPSAPCLAGKKNWWQLTSWRSWNRARRLTCLLSTSVTRKDLQFGTWTDPSFQRHYRLRHTTSRSRSGYGIISTPAYISTTWGTNSGGRRDMKFVCFHAVILQDKLTSVQTYSWRKNSTLLLPFIGFVIITDMNIKSAFLEGLSSFHPLFVKDFAGYKGIWIDTSYPEQIPYILAPLPLHKYFTLWHNCISNVWEHLTYAIFYKLKRREN